MNELQQQSEPSNDIPQAEILDREAGLHRGLTSWQVAMIGLGSTIGTGLFLGSALSVKLAGPAVLVSFLLGAIVAVTVMWALAEMAAEHPAAGSFGLYAEMYLHRGPVLRFATPTGCAWCSLSAARSSQLPSIASIGGPLCPRGCGSPAFRSRWCTPIPSASKVLALSNIGSR